MKQAVQRNMVADNKMYSNHLQNIYRYTRKMTIVTDSRSESISI